MTLSAAHIQTQDFKFRYQVPTGVWRWTTRLDVSGSSPTFSVVDIVSPYGLLRDSMPIPGVVIQAMSESIDKIKQNFPPSILLGPPTTLEFEVDEGRGFSDLQSVLITNDGTFGSILSASLASSASYMTVAPAVVGNLAANETGSFDVAVDSTTLTALDSPYVETVTIQDPNAPDSPQTVSVTIVVRPKGTLSFSPSTVNFSVSKPLSGAYPPIPNQQFTLTNTGPSGSVLQFQIQRLTDCSSNWLVGFAPVTGTLDSGESQVVTVQVAPDTNLLPGIYQETLRVSAYSTNSYVDVPIQLVIT